jgi:hypothetical protein
MCLHVRNTAEVSVYGRAGQSHVNGFNITAVFSDVEAGTRLSDELEPRLVRMRDLGV